MSNKIKGVKIRDGQGNLSDEIPIGALAQNVDYDIQADTNVKQKIDTIETRLQNIDLTSVVYKGSGVNSVIVNVVGENPNLSNTASGDYSCAEGYYTKALGANSHAEGGYSTAKEPNSHAEGYQTYAMGSSSHAEGNQTQASGGASHAEGQNTVAIGVGSHAEGKSTRASGISSHAEGQGTVAQSNNQTVFGKYNKIDSASNYIEIAGNGTGTTNDTRSNARTLDWDGNEWIAGSIKIGGIGYSDSNAKTIATVDQVQTLVDTAIHNSEEIQGLVNTAVSGITPASLSLDASLQAQNKAAPAATVGSRLAAVNTKVTTIESNLNKKIDNPEIPSSNFQGKVLKLDANGKPQWGDDIAGSTGNFVSVNYPINGGANQILARNSNNTELEWINQPDLSGYVQTGNLSGYVQKPKNNNQFTNGISGQILKTNGNGTTEWINQPDLSGYVQTNDLSGYVQTNALSSYAQKNDLKDYVKIPAEDRNPGAVLINNNDGNGIVWSPDLMNVKNNLIYIPKDANDMPTNGTSGQILKTNGDGTTTWIDLLKTLYNLKGRKFLFVGDSYCQGYSNTSADCNRGWAYYCAEKLGLKRTQTFSANNQIDDKYVRPVKDWNKDKKIYEMHDGQLHTYTYQKTENGVTTDVTETYSLPTRIINQTENDDYEIICNGGAKFAEAATGTTFDELIIDAKRKYPNQVFTDIVVCGGYNERSNSGIEIANGIRSFVQAIKTGYQQDGSQKPALYPNAKIYIGHIGYNKLGNGNNAVASYKDIRDSLINVAIPAYKASSLSDNTIYLNNVQYALQDKYLSNDDGYHPKDNGNRILGKAIAEALLNDSASFPYNVLDSRINSSKRRILFIGDVTLTGGTYNNTSFKGCYEFIQKNLHIFRSLGISIYPVKYPVKTGNIIEDTIDNSRIDQRENDSYKISTWKIAKFCKNIYAQDYPNTHPEDNFMLFIDLLLDAYERKYKGQDFTDIVVIGGHHEYDGYSIPVDDLIPNGSLSSNGQAVKTAIENAVGNFCNKVKELYPKANVYIACTGIKRKWKKRNKDNQQVTSGEEQFFPQSFVPLIEKPAYKSCESYNVNFIDCTESYTINDIIDPQEPGSISQQNPADVTTYSSYINNTGLGKIAKKITDSII